MRQRVIDLCMGYFRCAVCWFSVFDVRLHRRKKVHQILVLDQQFGFRNSPVVSVLGLVPEFQAEIKIEWRQIDAFEEIHSESQEVLKIITREVFQACMDLWRKC